MIRPLRAVVLEAHLDATPAEVWHALTDAQALADWFSRTASAQSGVGGVVELGWDEAAVWPTTIEVWEPERHLRWADTLPPGPDGQPQPRMFVDWFIGTENGNTVLRLVHSGFGTGAQWDDQIEGLSGGWRYFFWNLEQLFAHHRGRHRAMVWTRPRVPGTRDAFWESIIAEGVLALESSPSDSERRCTVTLGAMTIPGIVAVFEPPSRFAARLPELNEALLFVELEGSGPSFHAGFWLSTYGLESHVVESLQHSLTRAVDACVGRVGPTGASWSAAPT